MATSSCYHGLPVLSWLSVLLWLSLLCSYGSMTILASRDHTCINPEVADSSNRSEECTLLLRDPHVRLSGGSLVWVQCPCMGAVYLFFVCMCCVCTCERMCVYMSVHMCACVCACVCMCACVCAYVYMCMCICVYIYVFIVMCRHCGSQFSVHCTPIPPGPPSIPRAPCVPGSTMCRLAWEHMPSLLVTVCALPGTLKTWWSLERKPGLV